MGVGSTAPCDPYPRALFFDGAGYVFNGTQTVTDGGWFAYTIPSSHSPHHLFDIRVDPTNGNQGLSWTTGFAVPSGACALHPRTYLTAQRYPLPPEGIAGLSIFGDGRACGSVKGSFQIHKLTMKAGDLMEFVATFEQFCEGETNNVLRGCVKYTR